MASQNIEQSSSTYLRLKNEKGHWHNQPHNPNIDNFNGERHEAMLKLQEHLGKTGTPTNEIQRLMGEPTRTFDRPDLVLQHEFQQNNYAYPNNAKIWIYEWRGSHDYVYFVISADNKVATSGWYHAYE